MNKFKVSVILPVINGTFSLQKTIEIIIKIQEDISNNNCSIKRKTIDVHLD